MWSAITKGDILRLRTKFKPTEQEQKDKLNDTIILFVITFVVVLFGKLCIGESSSSTTVVKVSDVKGGQCPF